MDCTTFQESEIDALYGELDEVASAAMAAHAATCSSCAARFEGLRSTRGLVLSVAIEAVADDFESRIMAAVDAGLAKRPAAPSPAQPKAEAGAKILRFMARPSFAVAATFVLVLGAGAILMTTSRNASAPMAATESAPAASAFTPVPMNVPEETAAAQLGAVAAASPTAKAGAKQGSDDLALAAPVAAPAYAMAPTAGEPAPAKLAKKPAPAEDRAFTAAKTLFNAGRYADALPKFEALKASTPEAELYAARCIARIDGCAAAAPRFDSAAQVNAGTEIGSRATIEGAKCYRANGDAVAARQRLQTAKSEGILTQEATRELDSLDRSGGGAGSGGHAAPKSAAPSPAPPAAAPDLNRMK